jgi:hypothetical protein
MNKQMIADDFTAEFALTQMPMQTAHRVEPMGLVRIGYFRPAPHSVQF